MNDQIKKDNQKSFPKYIVVLLVCMIAGGVLGFFSSMIGSSQLTASAPEKIADLLYLSLPWLFPIICAVFLAPCFLWLHKAKSLSRRWDGESEELPDQVDALLNRSMLLITLLSPIGFFSISASMMFASPIRILVVAAEFLLMMFLCTSLQKSIVDLTRTLNPEKKGSIFDLNFQKTWVSSCDENERRQIGEAAYAAFKAANLSCVVIWLALVFAQIIFHTGLLAIFSVLLLWCILQVTYIVTCMKLSRRK